MEIRELEKQIESLTTENKRLTDHAENLRLDYVDLLAEKESLTTQLAESQRREKAAVEDIRSLDVRCRLCKHSIVNSGKLCCKTPSQTENGKCFEWRGVAEGEKRDG